MTIKLEKKHLILGAVVIAVCLVMGFGYHFYSVYSYEQNAKEFKARSSAILMPIAVVLDDYQKNWRSAIFDHEAYDETGRSRYCSDFNTAIGWRKDALKKVVSLIDSYFYHIEKLIKEMDNPPSKFERVQEKFVDIYNDLYKLKRQCISPEGSLQTFSSEINNLVSDIHTNMNETDITIPHDTKLMTKYIDEFTESMKIIAKVSEE